MSLAGSLEQVAKLSYGIEPPLVWRRHRLPTVTSARVGFRRLSRGLFGELMAGWRNERPPCLFRG